MDRRVIFLMVFATTLFSTILVATVSLWAGQSWVRTALFSVATMWIVGILSQILFSNLYQAIVKPLEEEAIEKKVVTKSQEINLDEVEAIEEATEKIRKAETSARLERANENAKAQAN